jgi:hypothetical protein
MAELPLRLTAFVVATPFTLQAQRQPCLKGCETEAFGTPPLNVTGA